MSTVVQTGWLKNNKGEKFAPKTLSSQIVYPDGKTFESRLDDILEMTIDASTILNFVYPVGSVYMSVSNVNPSTFIGGTWESFGVGKTLIGVDPNDKDFSEAEKIGGEKSHALSVAEMPTHSHTVNSHNHSIPALSGSAASAGTHNHTITSSSSDAGLHSHTISSSSGSAGEHTHTTSGTAASSGTHKHSVPHNAKTDTSGSGVQMIGYDSSNDTTASYTNRYTASAGAHTHSVSGTAASAGSHTHSISSTAANAGSHSHTISSSSANNGAHTHSISTTASTSGSASPATDSKGSSSAHNNLQPYITCYMWKRVA